MKSINEQKAFLEFMLQLMKNNSNYSKWKEFTEIQYQDKILENIRIKLINICTKDDSLGDNKWPLSDTAIKEINYLIEELRNEIS